MQTVIGMQRNPQATKALMEALRALDLGEGATLYLGYPIMASADDTLVLDGLLTSIRYGAVIIDLGTNVNNEDWDERKKLHDRLYLAVTTQLLKHASLCRGRQLAVPIDVIAFLPEGEPAPPEDVDLIWARPSTLATVLRSRMTPVEPKYFRALNAALQRVSTIKPARKREAVQSPNSRGAVLKQIEAQIANLDRWQNHAAIESPEGPQRIRGLAGSGKTIVLALKAAYLHAAHPDWTIVVTFYTRSLYDHFKDLIRRFSFEHQNDEPDWSRLRILHAWGSRSVPGFYSETARYYGLAPRDFESARMRFGRTEAFAGACNELLQAISDIDKEPPYDAVLIDEAQDFPDSFFKLVYRALKPPKRVVWAYDELQNLGDYSMKPPDELFGLDAHGAPLVELHNVEGQPKQDIILPVCYRNTPWALTIAHALGFGIYRRDGLVQFFDDPGLWKDIGYEVVAGALEAGHSVTLRRRLDAAPQFMRDLITPEDAVLVKAFDDEESQWSWVASEIERNLTEDELEAEDILVIFPNAQTVRGRASKLAAELDKRDIPSHIAGITTSPDAFFKPGSVALTGVYRAKGNEAAMVYVVDADQCHEGLELIRKRNILFTAITRSRAWVRLTGVGEQMRLLQAECERVVEADYRLKFTVPTQEQLKRLRRIHRDMTPEERSKVEEGVSSLKGLVESLESGDIDVAALPRDLRTRLLRLLKEQEEDSTEQ